MSSVEFETYDTPLCVVPSQVLRARVFHQSPCPALTPPVVGDAATVALAGQLQAASCSAR